MLTSYLTVFSFTNMTAIMSHNFQWPWQKPCNTTQITRVLILDLLYNIP
jgi:hypothetical protein